MMTGQSSKIRTRWNSATKVKIIPATMSNYLKFEVRDQGLRHKPSRLSS
jgi:hypothetical protein